MFKIIQTRQDKTRQDKTRQDKTPSHDFGVTALVNLYQILGSISANLGRSLYNAKGTYTTRLDVENSI